jgi:orotate phosphoribosyltransferase
MTALSGEGAWLIGQLFYHQLQVAERPVSSVGGMVLGAAPLVTSITAYSAFAGQAVDGFLVRKEAKAHGGTKQIEGHLAPHSRIILVEDVVTTGKSTLNAIDVIQAQYPSVDIIGVLALVDRHAGASQAFLQRGIPLHTLFGIDAFLQE